VPSHHISGINTSRPKRLTGRRCWLRCIVQQQWRCWRL